MQLVSQWQIAETIRDFLGSVDTFREEVYALEGDPFPEWWAKRNPTHAQQLTSLHEFVWALPLVGKLDFRFRRNALMLARLSVATYPHVPELVPIEQFLAALSSGSAVELMAMHARQYGPTLQALLKLTNDHHFAPHAVESDCYYLNFAEDIRRDCEENYRQRDEETLEQILGAGPFDAARVENPGPLADPMFFDSQHRAETEFESCGCTSERKIEYSREPNPAFASGSDILRAPINGLDSEDDGVEITDGNRAELIRVLVSKGLNADRVERFFDAVSYGEISAIEDGTWVSSTHQNRELADADGFTFRIEPAIEDGFDEQITLRFRRGNVRGFVRFLVPAGVEDRMSWGQEFDRALHSLTAFAVVDTTSPRDGRVGVKMRLDFISFSSAPSVTVFGRGDEPTRKFGPYQSLEDAARSATGLARRHFGSSDRSVP